MCSNPFLLIRENRFFLILFFLFSSFHFFCVRKAFVSHKSLSSAPFSQAPVSGFHLAACVLCAEFCTTKDDRGDGDRARKRANRNRPSRSTSIVSNHLHRRFLYARTAACANGHFSKHWL